MFCYIIFYSIDIALQPVSESGQFIDGHHIFFQLIVAKRQILELVNIITKTLFG